MGKRWFFDKANWSDGLAPDTDEYSGGWVSTAATRSGGVTIAHADSRILVDTEHLYLILDGTAPQYLTLRAPMPWIEKQLRDLGDVRQAEAGAFADWAVHIDGENRRLIYVLDRYRVHTDSYEATRVDG